jgi:beta-glucosidase
VLRNEWGFEGVVMTDWYSTNPGQGDNALCMSAGNDLIMPGMFLNKQQILLGLRTGKIARRDLQRCCGNVLRQILDSQIQREFR